MPHENRTRETAAIGSVKERVLFVFPLFFWQAGIYEIEKSREKIMTWRGISG
jgi:hypothetical protein